MSAFIEGWRRLRDDHYGNTEVVKIVLGLLALGLSFYLIKNTNINSLRHLVLPSVIMGFLATLRWPKKPSELYGYGAATRFALGLCANTVVWGGLFASLVLTINTYLPYPGDSESIEQKLPITERGSMIGETRRTREQRRVVFYVDINGASKGFTFPHEYYQKMDSFHHLLIRYKKGALGFEKIENIKALP